MTDGYQQIRQRLQDLFEKKDFENALVVAREIRDRFPEHYMASHYNLAYMQAALNKVGEAITTLDEGYSRGAWWTEDALNFFPNIEAMKADLRFQVLQKKILQRYEEEKKKIKLKLVIREPRDHDPDKPARLLIALHWGESNIEEFEPFWRDVVLNAGVLLALPQSSQLSSPNKFTWMDMEQGMQDLEKVYSEITEKYGIDSESVFLAGASIGAKLALEATFVRPKFPVKGVIVVMPYDVRPDELLANLELVSKQQIKCCLVVGTEDDSYESCKELTKRLQDQGMPVKFFELNGVGHVIPEDFDRILGEIMDFLLK